MNQIPKEVYLSNGEDKDSIHKASTLGITFIGP